MSSHSYAYHNHQLNNSYNFVSLLFEIQSILYLFQFMKTLFPHQHFVPGGKRRGEKPSVSPVNEQVDGQTVENGGRRASVPESKRSLTDTEQQYESEAENSVFSIGFSTSNLKFTNNRSHNNADHFKRQDKQYFNV